MFNIGFSELIVLAALALMFLKPEEIPALAKNIARFLNDLKRSSDSLKEEFKNSALSEDFNQIKNEIKEVGDSLKSDFQKSEHEINEDLNKIHLEVKGNPSEQLSLLEQPSEKKKDNS
jgi:sec-independent protein translocase protein TatB